MSRIFLATLLAIILSACAPTATLPSPTAVAPTAVVSTPSPAAPSAEPTEDCRDAAGCFPTVMPTAMQPLTPSPASAASLTPSPASAASLTATPAQALTSSPARLPRDQVALARMLGTCRPDPAACPAVARTTPLDVQPGETRSFFVSNIDTDSNSEIVAELRYIGPVVLMYVEVGLSFDQAALEAAARRFEQEIYPRTRALFGSEAQPGVDGDQRLTVLNASSPGGGVLGYFAARDSVPRQVNRFSNEREMFFMNIEALSFASPAYLDTLAHEFQHMIQRNEQPATSTWFNEGNSMLSQDLNGFADQGYVVSYLFRPDTQLNAWTDAPGETIPHYGAAQLFLRYMLAQYAQESDLLGLIRANAGVELAPFVELAARTRPEIDSFGALFADFAVANLLNDATLGDGRYGYATRPELPNLLDARVQPRDLPVGTRDDDVAQFGADYFALPQGPVTLTFQGDTSVNLVGERPRGTGWWSGRGDNSYATLTRPLDLRGVNSATLIFDAWYEIESDYDYAFVTISSDGGVTWETLQTTSSTDADPQGHNYGNGLTSISGTSARSGDGVRAAWVEERADLTPYAGQEVQLRFWQISDEGYNAPGLLLDNLRIPEINWVDDVEAGEGDWVAAGFTRVDGDLPQEWAIRLVRTAADGAVSVEPLAVDGAGRVQATLAAGERGVIMVAGVTPQTTERAKYTLTIQ
jgi:immune inhibitor A